MKTEREREKKKREREREEERERGFNIHDIADDGLTLSRREEKKCFNRNSKIRNL